MTDRPETDAGAVWFRSVVGLAQHEPEYNERKADQGGEDELVGKHFDNQGACVSAVSEEGALQHIEVIDEDADPGPHDKLVNELSAAGRRDILGAEDALDEFWKDPTAKHRANGGK